MADPAETTQASRAPAETEELLDAVRALSAQLGSLRGELQGLRAERGALPPVVEPPGWTAAAPDRQGAAWIRSLDAPDRRRPEVPRLLLEVLFLAAVALGLVLADAGAVAVAVVMALAWALVAAVEWAAGRAERELERLAAGAYAGPVAAGAEDPAWFAPPLERPALEDTQAGDEPGEDTAARLPPVAED